MLMPGEQSRTLEGRRERLDAVVPRVPRVPRVPPCGDGHRLFCEEAWVGIADKLELSQRQAEIARCVLAGQGNRQIARRLDVSSRTIQTHMKRLHEKLEIQGRIELATRVFTAYCAWRTDSAPPTDCPLNMGH